MREKFNPRTLEAASIFTVATLTLAACSGGGSPNQSPTATTAPRGPLKGSNNIHGCKGQISSLQDIIRSKDGEVFRITGINNNTCVDLTNPSAHKSIGSLSLGDEIVGPCLFDGETDNRRIHLLTMDGTFDYVGDASVTPEMAQSSALSTCDNQMPDIGSVQRS